MNWYDFVLLFAFPVIYIAVKLLERASNPKKPWVDLTPEEIHNIPFNVTLFDYARIVEKMVKEKNNE